ncbi:HNH endonuclease [Achromobacter mucicolens]|uniref:HNH endonuclease n=1 Tax=Achromobacter mucicolens TaxID=1389922 RepID=UPI002449EE8F|nr:HNH endonuclease [Achromobacter mucicolens]MDH0092637.1 HNH endonuclease [Achromobacter mucicolens]
MSTFTCLYCGNEKQQDEASLEHAIPQFLGGEYAPKFFQITTVCTKCNNGLGLWVDASYAKSWLVSNNLTEAARLLCTKLDDPGLPLRCIGQAQIPALNVPSDHVSEYWIGPSGETILWIRPHDDRMNPYAGGNPIDTKKKPSVAYYFPVSESAEKHALGLSSFHRAMERRKVRKIICTELLDANGNPLDPSSCGFDAPTPEDVANRAAIGQAIELGKIQAQVAVDTKFDLRFMCKLALGIGYSLFGDDFLTHTTASEARKGVWPRKDGTRPAIRGSSTLALADTPFAKVAGYPSAVAIVVMKIGSMWSMCVSIDEKLPFVIELGPNSMVSSHINAEEGYALLLFPYLKSYVELTVAALLAHKVGVMKNAELEKIDAIRSAAEQFNAQLLASP